MISFFSRLFKKAPSQTSLTPAAAPRTAPEPAAHAAATMGYGPALLALALSEDNKNKVAARQRLAQLLDNNTLSLEQVTADSENTEQLLALCSYSHNTAAIILSTYTDQHALAALANEALTAQVRKAAAEKVTARDALEAMLKGAKGKDKNVYKIAKTGLATFKAEDDALAEKHAQLASLCTDAGRHAKKPFDHLYVHKFTTLESDWDTHKANTTAELTARFEAAITKCQATIDAEIAAEKAKIKAVEDAQAELTVINAATAALTPIAEQLYAKAELTGDDISLISTQITAQENAVQNTHGNSAAHIKATQQFNNTLASLEALFEKTQALGTVNHNLQALTQTLATADECEQARRNLSSLLAFANHFSQLNCPIAQQATSAIAQWQQLRKGEANARKVSITQINNLVVRANIAASNGQVRRARGIYRELTEKCNALTDIPAGIASKLVELEETMAKLGDWHDFAVTPKKEALVATMAELQNSTLAPDDLADKIHDLQEEWKLLCKGGENQDEALWQAFQSAADKAFEPCKQHFAEQAQMREANAAQRAELVAQLEQYHNAYDWEKAAWKDVEQTLRAAKDAWKAFWPVPRQQQKDLQAAFDGVLDKIYAQMNAAYDLGKQQKEQLIALAEKAMQHTDPKVAAEDIKQLQHQWKKTGRTYRKIEQQLWNQFRTRCDEVFSKRQAIFDALNNEREQLQNSANDIIEKVSTLAKEMGSHLQSQGHIIQEFKDAFNTLGEVPKAEYQKFQRALSNIEQKITNHRQAAEQGAWQTLFTLNTQLSAIELQANNQSALAEFTKQLSTQKLPPQCHEIFKNRLLSTATPEQTEATAKALKILCIRAEILNGAATPEADKTLRMNYQVEALKENFGAAQQDTIESLTREWVRYPACNSDVLNVLQERFLANTFALKTPVNPAVEPA